MKTIRSVNEGMPARFTNKDADARVATGEWGYCKKSEWKEEVRDLQKRKLQEAQEQIKAERESKRKESKHVSKH